MPDLTDMSESQIKESLTGMVEAFDNAETAQEVAVSGKVLSMAYLKLHDRRNAEKVLESMIDRLRNDEDYVSVVEDCRNILNQIK